MISVILLVLISKAASQGSEPLSAIEILHVWDTGLEGHFFINPPHEIHSWVVHITLNQPVDVVEVSLVQNMSILCNYLHIIDWHF